MIATQILIFLARLMRSPEIFQRVTAATSESTARRFFNREFDYDPLLSTTLKVVRASGSEIVWHGRVIHCVDDFRGLLDAGLDDHGALVELADRCGKGTRHLYQMRYGPKVPRISGACSVARSLYDELGLSIRDAKR